MGPGAIEIFLGIVILIGIAVFVRMDRSENGGHNTIPARPPSKPRPGMEDWEDPFAGRVRTIPDSQKELRALPYGEYLQTPHWKRKREDKLRAVGRRCQVCNHGPDTLEVHHRTYERLGQELDEDLTVLCRACHGTFHDHRGLSR